MLSSRCTRSTTELGPRGSKPPRTRSQRAPRPLRPCTERFRAAPGRPKVAGAAQGAGMVAWAPGAAAAFQASPRAVATLMVLPGLTGRFQHGSRWRWARCGHFTPRGCSAGTMRTRNCGPRCSRPMSMESAGVAGACRTARAPRAVGWVWPARCWGAEMVWDQAHGHRPVRQPGAPRPFASWPWNFCSTRSGNQPCRRDHRIAAATIARAGRRSARRRCGLLWGQARRSLEPR
mmetsp:Transcript_32228/g.102750  ORF Transcript_32228/g.102750 Transcript_32228/m.102750 type:complete len:233 (-) Transcript_32228:585-1283(-)